MPIRDRLFPTYHFTVIWFDLGTLAFWELWMFHWTYKKCFFVLQRDRYSNQDQANPCILNQQERQGAESPGRWG